MVFRWKEGARQSVDANIAGEVLMGLSSQNRLNPETLVEVSRPEDAPLHKCFTWDDRKAADLYRKQEATILIRQIEVENETESGEAYESMAFHTLGRGTGYEFIDDIMEDGGKVVTLLSLALKELESFRVKYRHLKELAEILAAIDRLEKS